MVEFRPRGLPDGDVAQLNLNTLFALREISIDLEIAC
jgi:hypothetical protein